MYKADHVFMETLTSPQPLLETLALWNDIYVPLALEK